MKTTRKIAGITPRPGVPVVRLGADCAATLPPNALEHGLATLAPNVAILHDSEGRPAVAHAGLRARRRQRRDR